jgi:integrase/recombinase XerD
VDGLAVLAHWDAYLGAMGRAERTRQAYGYWCMKFLVRSGYPQLDAVTEDMVNDFLDSIGNRAPSKASAIHALKSLFGYAHDRGLIAADPTRWVKAKNPPKPEPVSLSEEELTRLLIAAAWRHPRRAWTLMLCYSLGTRRGELAALEPADVDLEAGEVHLRVTKGDRPRTVPLGPTATAAVEALRPWWNGTVLGGLHPSTVNLWASQAGRDAHLPPSKTHAHVLRRSFAKHLSLRGVSVEVISKLLGHSSLAVTTAYLSVERDEKARAVALL